VHNPSFILCTTSSFESNIRRRRLHIDPILIEEPASEDEWLIETEKPCLTDDLAWLDEARENNE